MMSSTHAVGGLSTALIVNHHLLMFGIWDHRLFVLTSASVVGAVLADIDHPNSLVGRRFKRLSAFLKRKVGRRTLTHSLLSVLLLASLLFVVDSNEWQFLFYPVLGLLLGHTSHIVLDMLTKQGVALFYPFIKKKKGLGLISTGGYFEIIFSCIMIFVTTSIVT